MADETKPKIGRPTKLTPEVEAKIVETILAGNWLLTAARAVGIDKTTLHDWLRRGRSETDGIYAEFVRVTDMARAQVEIEEIAIVRAGASAANGRDWKAYAWLLERRDRKRFGPAQRHEVTGPNGGPIKIDAAELAKRIEQLAADDAATHAGSAACAGAGGDEPSGAGGDPESR